MSSTPLVVPPKVKLTRPQTAGRPLTRFTKMDNIESEQSSIMDEKAMQKSKFEILNNVEDPFGKFEVNLTTIGTAKGIEGGKKMVVAKSQSNFHSKENQGK